MTFSKSLINGRAGLQSLIKIFSNSRDLTWEGISGSVGTLRSQWSSHNLNWTTIYHIPGLSRHPCGPRRGPTEGPAAQRPARVRPRVAKRSRTKAPNTPDHCGPTSGGRNLLNGTQSQAPAKPKFTRDPRLTAVQALAAPRPGCQSVLAIVD